MLLVRLINRLADSAGMLAERYPCHVAAGQVVALGIGIAALALFGLRQLLEAVIKLLLLPAHLYGIDDHFPRQMRGQVIGNNPLNIAFRGHPLKDFYAKGHFFQAYFYPPAPALRRQFERVQALVAAGFAQAHQVVVFQGISSGESCTRASYRTLPCSRRRRIRSIGPHSPRILLWRRIPP